MNKAFVQVVNYPVTAFRRHRRRFFRAVRLESPKTDLGCTEARVRPLAWDNDGEVVEHTNVRRAEAQALAFNEAHGLDQSSPAALGMDRRCGSD